MHMSYDMTFLHCIPKISDYELILSDNDRQRQAKASLFAYWGLRARRLRGSFCAHGKGQFVKAVDPIQTR